MILRFTVLVDVKDDALSADAGHADLAAILAGRLGDAMLLSWVVDYEVSETRVASGHDQAQAPAPARPT